MYRGQPYLRDDLLCELAPTAIAARADRLSGVPNAWEYHPCPFCGCENGMSGAHLLQCENLPLQLASARDDLRASLPIRDFAVRVVSCQPTELVKRGLHFAQRVFRAARRAVRAPVSINSQQSEVAGDEFTTVRAPVSPNSQQSEVAGDEFTV